MSASQKTFPYSLGPVLEYTLKALKKYRSDQHKLPSVAKNASSKLRPLVVGISGPQGLGKSTLAAALQTALEAPQNGNLHVQRFSLDDVYLTHQDQQELSTNSNGNPLLRTRGQPGTHDLNLCVKMLDALCGASGRRVQVPIYDKAAYSGEGDREFEGNIPETNSLEKETGYLDVVIFEGWCVGFQSLTAEDLSAGIRERLLGSARGSNKLFNLLAQHPEYLTSVNEHLAAYQAIWDYFDVFVHLDAGDIGWVYDWRLEQEHKLIAERGTGQSDEQVREFINGYMSSYYLYVPRLRACNARGPLVGKHVRAHIRLVVDKSRNIAHIINSEADRERL
ncbi:uncharacterized protein SAPINGB_P005838 [Magnusiomyces paraingens]|uniref:Phosphoribulokinase/uridine kinase domain-containing protein n=1 Tax=Magnusiomyces paraingens TaxID=2606893 RepID=A0A5E8C1W0_9ASCO|nr:uncharacterized protein SAPINGB_P005838 [Saprochaete ingens]VVT57724.1 unnamed protein product [Saprochaete ingens]